MPATVIDDAFVIHLSVGAPASITPVVGPLEDTVEVITVLDAVAIVDAADRVAIEDVADRVIEDTVIGVVEVEDIPDEIVDCVS